MVREAEIMHPREPEDDRRRMNRTSTGWEQQLLPSQNRPMSTEEIATSYADVADSLARWRFLDRLFAGRYRRRQFEKADGRVLDVACGTGRNFRYLAEPTEIVGVDISDAMLSHASDELDRLDVKGSVSTMDAEALAFDDDRFDTVISSFSLCTFPSPGIALSEMGRVCTPNGRILLLEHSRSDVGLIGRLQDRRAESHYQKAGCRLNHEPLQTVRQTDLGVERVDTQFMGLVTAIEATPQRE